MASDYAHPEVPGVYHVEEWVLGPLNTPFYTQRVKHQNVITHPSEHNSRYNHWFPHYAAQGFHITAIDQRGSGRTSLQPLTAESPQVVQWRQEGKTVKLETKSSKRRNGGWAGVMPDLEWWVKHEKERAGGKPLFLHGFSMGGGQVLGFVTRPQPPPSKATIDMLAGIIAGGPLIRLTKPAPWIQLKSGSLAANMGLGNFLVPSALNVEDLSHNEASNARAAADPFNEQVGTMRGLADMLNYGASLDSPAGWNAWPENMPLLIYHGGEDKICDPKVAERFVEKVKAKDKTFKEIKGMFHEVHNELEPTPTEVIEVLATWIKAHIPPSSKL